MSPATIAALGALLTGVASLISAVLSNRSQRKKGVDECDKRIEQLSRAFREGLTLKEKLEEDRWSGLP